MQLLDVNEVESKRQRVKNPAKQQYGKQYTCVQVTVAPFQDKNIFRRYQDKEEYDGAKYSSPYRIPVKSHGIKICMND
jgi:hypothetical protein